MDSWSWSYPWHNFHDPGDADSRNIERISVTIDELTIINYKTLTLGLYLLTIGTFLERSGK
jgi:hypothetical protein